MEKYNFVKSGNLKRPINHTEICKKSISLKLVNATSYNLYHISTTRKRKSNITRKRYGSSVNTFQKLKQRVKA